MKRMSFVMGSILFSLNKTPLATDTSEAEHARCGSQLQAWSAAA
jgi:hypothetical protein